MMLSVFTAALALTSMAVLGVAQEPNCARNYTVQLGDTCNSISALQNVSTFQLAHVNSDKINPSCSNLAEGEPLCLGQIGQDCNITAVVNSGDTCASIDTTAGIPLSTLLNNNPNVNSECTNILVGEVLCTSSQLFDYFSTA